MFFSSANDVTGMEDEITSKENRIDRTKKEILKDKKDLEVFKNKLETTDLKFISGSKNFGIYHLMEFFDDLSENYPLTYNIKNKPKKLTKYYFSYEIEFTIKYEEKNKFKNLINKLTKKYYCSFVKGTFKKNKFILTYNFYGRNK
jgi:hypothetical protein